MTEKILWVDTETTNTNPETGAVIQLAGMIELDGVVDYEFNFRAQPHPGSDIQPEALEVNGKTIKEIMAYPPAAEAVNMFKAAMHRSVDPYNRSDKYVFAGYNSSFDFSFIYNMIQLAGDKYGLGSWCFSARHDVMTYVALAIRKRGLRLKNYKLETLCEFFEIPLKAHDAMADIRATRLLDKALVKYIKTGAK